MTNKSALLELASRCEAATGPDRDLDWAITQVRHPSENPHPRNQELFLLCDGHFRRSDFNYTASLDAAMSLVPEGWDTQLRTHVTTDGTAMAVLTDKAWFDEEPHGSLIQADAGTASLALTAAALRALAEKGE